MTQPPSQSSRKRSTGFGTSVLTFLFLAAICCIWCSCTVTKSNYSTLSFLFDGVPDPNAPAVAANQGDSTLAAVVVIHPPFKEEKCEACHKTQYRPNRNDPSACLSCHKDLADKHVWTHGAVAGGACLWCHSPHESARKWLLRSPDQKLCMQCHSATMMNGKDVPAHVDAKIGCLECHFGHGGDDARMLKPGASAASPPSILDGPAKHAVPPSTGPTQPLPPPGSPSTVTPPGNAK